MMFTTFAFKCEPAAETASMNIFQFVFQGLR